MSTVSACCCWAMSSPCARSSIVASKPLWLCCRRLAIMLKLSASAPISSRLPHGDPLRQVAFAELLGAGLQPAGSAPTPGAPATCLSPPRSAARPPTAAPIAMRACGRAQVPRAPASAPAPSSRPRHLCVGGQRRRAIVSDGVTGGCRRPWRQGPPRLAAGSDISLSPALGFLPGCAISLPVRSTTKA